MNCLFCIGIYPVWLLLQFKADNFAMGVGIDWSDDVDIAIIAFRLGPFFLNIAIGQKPGMAEYC